MNILMLVQVMRYLYESWLMLLPEVVGFEAKIVWDKSKPDGTPRKLMDTSNLHNLGLERSSVVI
jgi:hypothetical protein